MKDFFSKFDQIQRKLRIWSHLLKKSLMKGFIFCAVELGGNDRNPPKHFIVKQQKKRKQALREKFRYSEFFWSLFSNIWTECSVRMWENTDQNNSECGHFSRSKIFTKLSSVTVKIIQEVING